MLRDDYVSRREVENMASADGKVVNLVNSELEDLDKMQQQPTIIHDESTIPVTMINATRGEITCIAFEVDDGGGHLCKRGKRQ